jgi:ketosteroid isomerase-like protein
MMPKKWSLSILTALMVFGIATTVHGQDLTALQASFKAEIEALDSENLDAAVAEVHEDIVLFGVFSPFPIVGKEAFQQTVQEYFDQHDEAIFVPTKSEFRVIGSTGVTWGNYMMSIRPKGGSSVMSRGRYIFTYTQTDGAWKLLTMHISPLLD